MTGRLDDKICLVTGATNGVGRATVQGLARLGAHVVAMGRDPAKVAAVVGGSTGSGGASGLVADFMSLAAVRDAAREFRDRYERLDVLINNAGLWLTRRHESADGLEGHFAVNHLAHFLLTDLLRPHLLQSAAARVVTVSSALHHRGHIDWDDLQLTRRYGGIAGYCNSKLANVLFSNQLARRLADTSVTSNSLHPGVVRSGLAQGGGGIMSLMMTLTNPFKLSPAKGARTSLHVAAAPELAGVSGRYFDNCREAPMAPAARDPAAATRLWQVSEDLTARFRDNA